MVSRTEQAKAPRMSQFWPKQSNYKKKASRAKDSANLARWIGDRHIQRKDCYPSKYSLWFLTRKHMQHSRTRTTMHLRGSCRISCAFQWQMHIKALKTWNKSAKRKTSSSLMFTSMHLWCSISCQITSKSPLKFCLNNFSKISTLMHCEPSWRNSQKSKKSTKAKLAEIEFKGKIVWIWTRH